MSAITDFLSGVGGNDTPKYVIPKIQSYSVREGEYVPRGNNNIGPNSMTYSASPKFEYNN